MLPTSSSADLFDAGHPFSYILISRLGLKPCGGCHGQSLQFFLTPCLVEQLATLLWFSLSDQEEHQERKLLFILGLLIVSCLMAQRTVWDLDATEDCDCVFFAILKMHAHHQHCNSMSASILPSIPLCFRNAQGKQHCAGCHDITDGYRSRDQLVTHAHGAAKHGVAKQEQHAAQQDIRPL